MEENDLLEHAFVNQLEADFEDNDFDSMSAMIQALLESEDNKQIILGYLSDSAKENLIEGRTSIRY
jgi:ABC-type uncharacterized transport system involved in gliding motility auxiliary subunit